MRPLTEVADGDLLHLLKNPDLLLLLSRLVRLSLQVEEAAVASPATADSVLLCCELLTTCEEFRSVWL